MNLFKAFLMDLYNYERKGIWNLEFFNFKRISAFCSNYDWVVTNSNFSTVIVVNSAPSSLKTEVTL